MLVKRAAGVAVVSFWVVMNGWLLQRQLSAPPAPIALPAIRALAGPVEEWWGIYYRGEKIGYATQAIRPGEPGYRIADYAIMRLRLLDTTRTAVTRLNVEVDPEWALERFDFDLQSDGVRFKARGRAAAGRLVLEVESAGHATKREIPLTQTPYLPAALKPFIATQQLQPGKEYYFSTFDPASLSQQVTTVVVEGREQIRVGDRTEPAMRVRQKFRGISVVSWLDGAGGTLREESPAGFTLVRQSPNEAKAMPSGPRAVPLDLIAATAIAPDRPVEHPERLRRMRLRLGGVETMNFPMLGLGRQKLRGDVLEIRREELQDLRFVRLPVRDRMLASYLQPTPFLQSDHPKIRDLASRIVGRERDAREAAERIRRWVHRELAKQPTVSVPNALQVLELKRGDCNEHTVLFNALARAAGLPAKTVVGVAYVRNAFYYHAWSEVWLGQWVSLDATLDQFPADAAHVKFLEGDIDRQIDVLQLIGRLSIRVIEAS
ncbi:MAG TPA: transglutaminase-like domain-containing protein [candidate division Zixibacteria bacterium]|nr:transglutaminase-like domain-containing protein [candidate division Zixibacteria bacterium]